MKDRLRVKVAKARIANRWDEKNLHAPADVSIFIAGITTAASAGPIALAVLIVLAIVAAVVFVS